MQKKLKTLARFAKFSFQRVVGQRLGWTTFPREMVEDIPNFSLKRKGHRVILHLPRRVQCTLRLPKNFTAVAEELDASWLDAAYPAEALKNLYEPPSDPAIPPLKDATPEQISYRNSVVHILDLMQSDFDLTRPQAYSLFGKLFPDGILPVISNGSLVVEAMKLAEEFIAASGKESLPKVDATLVRHPRRVLGDRPSEDGQSTDNEDSIAD